MPGSKRTVPDLRNAIGVNRPSSCAVRVRPHRVIAPIAFKITVETGAADAENLRGAKPIAVAHLQHFLDVDLADLIKSERLPVLVTGEPWCAVLKMFRQIAEVDEVACSRDACCGNDIFEFANISRPGEEEEDVECARRPNAMCERETHAASVCQSDAESQLMEEPH
jgi:hypothetical protein